MTTVDGGSETSEEQGIEKPKQKALHQTRVDSDLLVLVAASTLADFLAGALSVIGEGGIGAELVNSWEVVGFRHTPNQFQELVKTSLTHPF